MLCVCVHVYEGECSSLPGSDVVCVFVCVCESVHCERVRNCRWRTRLMITTRTTR